jgi:hypothetical protein
MTDTLARKNGLSNPHYILVLMNDNENTFDHVISSLMLLTFDYEYAAEMAKLTHLFGREVIYASTDRDEINCLKAVLLEEKLKVVVVKNED